MMMNAICKYCLMKFRVPERMIGQQVKCPACGKEFLCTAGSRPVDVLPLPPADAASAVQTTPQSPIASVPADQNIHYRCPRCQKSLVSPPKASGQKMNCPECGQRLQVPKQSPSATPAPVNRTILATEIPDAVAGRAQAAPISAPAPPVPAQEEILDEVIPVLPSARSPAKEPEPAGRRDYCLECGTNVTKRQRVLTCPNCGSLFCSARCFRDHDSHAHKSARR
jgi:DNA-directed RNA polymerase subunit RPC12/RpoP